MQPKQASQHSTIQVEQRLNDETPDLHRNSGFGDALGVAWLLEGKEEIWVGRWNGHVAQFSVPERHHHPEPHHPSTSLTPKLRMAHNQNRSVKVC